MHKVKVLQIRKISSLVDFHGLYQWLHSQVYCNGLKPWISNVKVVMINEGKSNRKLPKMFAGKNLWMTYADLILKKAWCGMLKIYVCTSIWVEPLTKFSKRGGFTGLQRGGLVRKREVTFRGGRGVAIFT